MSTVLTGTPPDSTSMSPRCPHPEKRAFNTEAYAEAVAKAQSFRARHPIYTYACDCGHFHLTKQPPSPSAKRRKRTLVNNITSTLENPPIEAESVLVWSSEMPTGQIEELLDRARAGSSKAQAYASKIDALVVELSAVMDRDAERAVKEERAAILRAELAVKMAELEALEADLADDDPPADADEQDEDEPEADEGCADLADHRAPEAPQFPASHADAGTLTTDDINDLAAHFAYDGRVRGWARKNGYECGSNGRISAQLVKMWIVAHPDEAAAAR